jgi:hypothetical protein
MSTILRLVYTSNQHVEDAYDFRPQFRVSPVSAMGGGLQKNRLLERVVGDLLFTGDMKVVPFVAYRPISRPYLY